MKVAKKKAAKKSTAKRKGAPKAAPRKATAKKAAPKKAAARKPAATKAPATKRRATTGQASSPGISSSSPTTSSTASAAWAKACRCRSHRTAGASSGSRTRARRRTSPPSTYRTRASPRWCARPTCRRATCAPIRWSSAGNIMAVAYQTQKVGPAAGGLRAVRHLRPGEAALDLVLRLLGPAFARRAPALVLRRRVRPHGRRRARLQADASARRPVLPLHRRAQSVEAGRGRPLVACPARAQGDNEPPPPRHARSTRATARTTPTSIRSGRTAAISPISTAACSCSTSPTSPIRSRLAAGTIRRPTPALRIRCCRCSTATAHAGDRRVDRRTTPRTGRSSSGSSTRARRPTPFRSPPVRCPPTTPMRRGGRFGAHNIHENVPLPTCWHSDQIVLGTFFNGGLRAYDLSNPYQPQADRRPSCRRRRRCADRNRSSSTTCSSTSARSSTRSTGIIGGLYILEMDF